jgi:RsiW-degrading membrane proteinase PrsW (M82 family)
MPAHAPIPPAQERRAGQVNDLLPLGDWVRHDSLRSWPVLLFLALICVPSIALVILGGTPSASTFDHVAWIFAAYFAVAWLLLLGVIIRPEHVTRTMLVVVTAIALVTQVPLAIMLETALHSGNAALGQSIFTIGVPEELAKAVPVLVVGVIYRRSHGLMPRDYLFLGAVSGLIFGASEVVHYFTVNGIGEFYQTVKSAIPAIEQLLNTGHSASTSVFEVLIGPVLYFILDFVWRFVTDPVTHACWSGLTGYFIGLAELPGKTILIPETLGVAMSKQQRDAIDAALRAEPFGLNQGTDEHRKSFEAFALRPYPADVAAADATLSKPPLSRQAQPKFLRRGAMRGTGGP